jgi:hypothetical protein
LINASTVGDGLMMYRAPSEGEAASFLTFPVPKSRAAGWQTTVALQNTDSQPATYLDVAALDQNGTFITNTSILSIPPHSTLLIKPSDLNLPSDFIGQLSVGSEVGYLVGVVNTYKSGSGAFSLTGFP